MKLMTQLAMLLIAYAAVTSFAALGGTGQPTGAAAALKVKQTWVGVARDNALKALAPQPAIVDKETLTRIWQGWSVAGAPPTVDFTKEIVLITYADGPNRLAVANVTLDDKGNVLILAMATEMAGPGFGYGLLLMDRAGIKSVEGKAIVFPAAAPATERASAAQPGDPVGCAFLFGDGIRWWHPAGKAGDF